MIRKKNIFNVFVIFLFFHVFTWTLIPSLSNINLPLDTIEALAWGSNLEWGFNKHPPMSAAAVELIYLIWSLILGLNCQQLSHQELMFQNIQL